MGQSNPDRYTTPLPYIKGYIREYDMSKANISILYYKHLISKEQYDYLYTAPRMERQVTVGLMQKNDPELSKSLLSGFAEARQLFYDANGITQDDIVSVRKDAIFVLNKVPKDTDFGCLHFTCRNTYNVFCKLLDKIEAYYAVSSDDEFLDIKGIGDETLKLHEGYMSDILATIFSCSMVSAKDAIDIIQNISSLYLNWQINPNNYREFNNRSLFRTFYRLQGGRAYLQQLPEDIERYKKFIDTSYNYCLLQHLYSIFINMMI